MLHWSNARGESLDGMLLYPLNYSADKRYPMVIDTYGGASTSLGMRNSNWLASAFGAYSQDAIQYFMCGIAPWEDASIYTALTPIFHADKIATPLLLAAGDREPLILPTIEMYNVLRYLLKDVTLLRYTTEGHELAGAADEDFTRRIGEFFGRYLE